MKPPYLSVSMKRKTKIVATMGPAVADQQSVERLKQAGMNVARLNCSHGDWETKRDFVRWIRELHDGMNPIGILADLQGPKFRIAEVDGGVVVLNKDQSLTLGHGHGATIPMYDDEVFAAMAKGDRLLFGDGDVEVKLGNHSGGLFEGKAVTGGKIKSRQGVTLVGKSFDVPPLTKKDLADIESAATFGVDFIALSYVRCGDDMRRLRQVVDKFDPMIKLVAKVETRDALNDIDDVVAASDAVMVARGDLGLQMDLEDVPLAQKRIIRRSHMAGKPVITATQMLESMVTNGRPTRAEVSDVANAILDGTDAVMLSGETASGAYPIEAVQVMARVAEKAESIVDHSTFLTDSSTWPKHNEQTEAVALAAVSLANTLKVKAILATSSSGLTPRLVAKFRPKAPIYCATWHPRIQNNNSLVWGVQSINMPPTSDTDEAVDYLISSFVKMKLLKLGDRVVVTAGVPVGSVGSTNMVQVRTVI
ncbi:MAG: pyruvate kinase [Chthonomonadaceae bacterium]|nr:pyruvate kinase [Chthonomonadaceae bacterium]